jgi:UDP-3-O-[3-hydroxymyristoyl] glucosamine N-acyltransferase
VIDPRFYELKGAVTAAELAAEGGFSVVGGDPERKATSLASAAFAGAEDLTFLEDGEEAAAAETMAAAICFTPPAVAQRHAWPATTVIAAASARGAFARAATRMFAVRDIEGGQPAIHPGAGIGENCSLGPGCVIGAGAAIGAGSRIGANAVIGPGVQIGRRASIGANVTIRCALIGDDVSVLPGAVIGETGFGLTAGTGSGTGSGAGGGTGGGAGGGVILTPHFGRVIIQDGSSIGANCCIDRGLFDDTVLGEKVHIDNLCHIAHNVKIGSHTVMAAFAGISGSVEIADGVMFGGRVGIADHVKIGRHARLGAGAAVMRDVPSGETHAGYPAKPIATWMRELAWLARESQKRPAKTKAKD